MRRGGSHTIVAGRLLQPLALALGLGVAVAIAAIALSTAGLDAAAVVEAGPTTVEVVEDSEQATEAAAASAVIDRTRRPAVIAALRLPQPAHAPSSPPPVPPPER